METHKLWLMEQGELQAMCQRLSSGWPTPEQLNSFRADRTAAATQLRSVKGRVAVLPIRGVMEHRLSPFAYAYGDGFSTEEGESVLRSMADNPSVDAIVLDVDSPGGSTYGVQEFSDAIFAARKKKKIYAVANPVAASAAYWTASASDRFYVTPSGDVGSIGVYMVHADESEAWGKMGVKFTVIKAGKYKAEGHPFEPLSSDARDHYQTLVDETYGKFIDAVARNRGRTRGEVREKFGQGRLVSADEGLKAGMVDGVRTMTDVMGVLTGGTAAPKGAVSVEIERARHEQRKRTA